MRGGLKPNKKFVYTTLSFLDELAEHLGGFFDNGCTFFHAP
jgi:hypothetical protein